MIDELQETELIPTDADKYRLFMLEKFSNTCLNNNHMPWYDAVSVESLKLMIKIYDAIDIVPDKYAITYLSYMEH